MPIPVGTQFGECEILAPLGVGGMGEVYRARDKSLGREVAIKVLPAQLAADPERLRRFELEAQAAAALNHPNILAVHQFGTSGEGIPYLVTELLQGQTLAERLEQGALPVRKAVDYALQIARGLAAAHERGIVHRDLKPGNIFLTRDGLVKILDFGLARLVMPEGDEEGNALTAIDLTLPGMVLGTVGYMSPEQVRGKAADPRSDIFSLGVILYEMLSGQRAFSAATSADTMSAILKEEPPDLSAIVKNPPPALGTIAHRCLEKNPGERFQSARDLAFKPDGTLYYIRDLASVNGVPDVDILAARPENSDGRILVRLPGLTGRALGHYAAGNFARREVAGRVASRWQHYRHLGPAHGGRGDAAGDGFW